MVVGYLSERWSVNYRNDGRIKIGIRTSLKPGEKSFGGRAKNSNRVPLPIFYPSLKRRLDSIHSFVVCSKLFI